MLRKRRLGIGNLGLAPRLDLPVHRLKVPLDAVHSDGQRIDPVKALGVPGQDWREHAWDSVSRFWSP